jgi:hypothetical protein
MPTHHPSSGTFAPTRSSVAVGGAARPCASLCVAIDTLLVLFASFVIVAAVVVVVVLKRFRVATATL